MGRILIIAGATYRETGRQPILYILTGFSAVLIYFSRWFTLFSFHESDEMNMIREMGVASITVCGIFAAVVLAALAITSEVEKLTTLTILSKPVHRSEFLLGKYLGILRVLFLCWCFLTLALVYTLWEKEGQRHLEKVSDYVDLVAYTPRGMAQFTEVREAEIEAFPDLSRRLPFLFAEQPGADGRPVRSTYLFRVPFLGPCPLTKGIYEVLTDFFGRRMLDLLAAAALAFIQIAVLAAFAVGVAPHLPLVVNGGICLLVFVLGHLSTYAYDFARTGGVVAHGLGALLYALIPNLSLFNASSLLSVGSEISGRYVAAAGLYGLVYLSAVLTIAMALFSRKEIR